MDYFEGKSFTIQNGYFRRGKNALHRLLWEKAYGPIPKGHHIHHKDHNKLNNSLENLECLSHSDHLRLHMKISTVRNEWHKTEVGRKAMGEKAVKCWQNRTIHTLKCLHCGNDYQAKQIDRAKYCDNKCEQAARRLRGDDLVDRSCAACGKIFRINKYHKTLTCGYKCGGVYRTRNAKGKRKSKKKVVI